MKFSERLFGYIRKYRKNLGATIALSILYSFFSAVAVFLTIPLLRTLFLADKGASDPLSGGSFVKNLTKFIEDLILSSGPLQGLTIICILILAAYFLKNVTGYVQSINMQRIEKGVMRDLRDELYSKVNNLSLRFFTTEKTGDLISRMTNDVNAIQMGVSATFLDLVRAPILIAVYLFLALSISWKLTMMSLLVFPLTIFIIVKIGASLKRRSLRMQSKAADVLSVITETIYGSKVIRAFGATKYMDKLFKKESEKLYDLTIRNAKASELAQPVTEFLSVAAATLIIWIGGREILSGKTLDASEFIGFIFIIFQLATPIKNLSSVNNRIQMASASADRIFQILDHPVEIRESDNPAEFSELTDGISIKDMSFEYEHGKPVLDSINLEIRKSKIVALVGPSGAGKSTLADLIARFYDVTSGSIAYDGVNLKDISISSLRRTVGIVQQETILFNDTIRNNIIFGMENVKEDELKRICRAANAYEFIMKTEKGFDTVIGERGLKLSGGQRQRISIARTLLRNPSILILDEATSSLDTESEQIVQNAIDSMMMGRTSIVIAHRLSTIINADKIVVIDKGRIVQQGTHRELIAEEGLYKRLYFI